MIVPKDFADELVRSLDEIESNEPGRYLKVSEIREIAERLSIPFPDDLSVPELIEELLRRDWIEADGDGVALATHRYRISAKGQNRAAASTNFVHQFNQAMRALPELGREDVPTDGDEFSPDQPIRVDTTDWTGLAKAVSPQNLKSIREQSKALQSTIMQSDADIQTKTDACKRVEAVIILLEAPNVPWREVVALLNHPTVTAFLAAISLIQFIIGLAA